MEKGRTATEKIKATIRLLKKPKKKKLSKSNKNSAR